jgi:hypothetical protein
MDKGNTLGDYQYTILQAQGWLDHYTGMSTPTLTQSL